MAKVCKWEGGCTYSVFSKGLCISHWGRVYGKKIKQVSDKRKMQHVVYRARVNIYLKKNPLCMAGLAGCGVKATEVHHKQGRDGDLLLDEGHWLAICEGCHKEITEHSKDALESGLSEFRNRK